MKILKKFVKDLNIDKWLVFGELRTTLSLCYAIKHPERVLGF